MEIRNDFINYFKNTQRLVILAVGNEIRKDDGVGPKIVKELEGRLKPNVKIIDSGTVPESFTSVIKKFNPSHILIIDAAGMGENPGTVKFIDKNKIIGYSFSTHQMPLSLLIEFLEGELPSAKIHLLGIQPADNEFGEGLTPKVEKAKNNIVNLILELFGTEGGNNFNSG
ncbi:MAG: hydrogenase maturation peptidase HycI, partial [Candidatus Odinarchaeia archaeon]